VITGAVVSVIWACPARRKSWTGGDDGAGGGGVHGDSQAQFGGRLAGDGDGDDVCDPAGWQIAAISAWTAARSRRVLPQASRSPRHTVPPPDKPCADPAGGLRHAMVIADAGCLIHCATSGACLMAHIDLGVDETQFPGITGPMQFRPETAKPLNELAEVLLRAPHSLTAGERELVAAYVSGLNECTFCCSSHSAFAAAQLDDGMTLIDQVHADPDSAPLSGKIRALLRIAAAVREDGRKVTTALVDAARAEGATDLEIHDTVLIAAAFCMYNRYVDGLGTLAPDNPDRYTESARRIVEHGYLADK
jgi:uncharacterized peroxidase-related enzyme